MRILWEWYISEFIICHLKSNCIYCKGKWETDLRDKNIKAGMLVVPTELIYIFFSTERFAIALNVIQEIVVLSGPS